MALAAVCLLSSQVSETRLRAAEPAISVRPDHPDALYAPGETVAWTITGTPGVPLRYSILKDGGPSAGNGTLDLSSGKAVVEASRGEPGALVLRLFKEGNTVNPDAVGGAVFGWPNIRTSLPAPEDFDDFWKQKLDELAAVPPNPVLEEGEPPAGTGNVRYWKVTLDNIRGTKVRAQLAKPEAEGRYPALLILQFAGVYPLKKTDATAAAQQGWLALNVSAHDIPIDEQPAFYEDLKKGALKDYAYQGSEDRESSYFLRMFLGCVRAAEYLASRPDWDGKTLVVTGVSQGGLQSLATAALFPQTSAMIVGVPAGCDMSGPLDSPPRGFGWPYWVSNWGPKRDQKKVEATAPYFDGINFASRIKCPSLIAVGLLDETSRPAGVIAAFHAIRAPKELVFLPKADHHGSGGSQQLFFQKADAWKKALAAGKEPQIPEGGTSVDPFR